MRTNACCPYFGNVPATCRQGCRTLRLTITLDQAFTFALTPNLQIDFGGNFGLNSISPRHQVYAGISQRS